MPQVGVAPGDLLPGALKQGDKRRRRTRFELRSSVHTIGGGPRTGRDRRTRRARAVGAGGLATLYRGLVRPPFLSGNPAILQADPVGPLGPLPAGSDLVAELAAAVPGAVLLASDDLVDLLGRWGGQSLEVDVDIDVQMVQNGDGRRALVVPVIGIATPGFAHAPHRLTLALTRKRWETTDAPDELNTYAGSATLSLDL